MSPQSISRRALEVIAALEQVPDGLRLSELSETTLLPQSGVRTVVRSLIADGFISMSSGQPVRYFVSPRGDDNIEKIFEVLPKNDVNSNAIVAALRANPAVEFASRDEQGLLIILRWDAEPIQEVLLNRMLRRFDLKAICVPHDEVRDQLRESGALRERAHKGILIRGSSEQSFPDPFRHGSSLAPCLGHLHPTIKSPSQRALNRIASRFGLAEIRVFGSAVHDDFRADSDIDIAVRRQSQVRRTLTDVFALRQEFERLFERDVDVVDMSLLREPVRLKAETEGIVLYG